MIAASSRPTELTAQNSVQTAHDSYTSTLRSSACGSAKALLAFPLSIRPVRLLRRDAYRRSFKSFLFLVVWAKSYASLC